ncbi:hypothetical protein PENTCL1PPCAC_237, partial [Pristionchus entomophagus]
SLLAHSSVSLSTALISCCLPCIALPLLVSPPTSTLMRLHSILRTWLPRSTTQWLSLVLDLRQWALATTSPRRQWVPGSTSRCLFRTRACLLPKWFPTNNHIIKRHRCPITPM